MIVRAHPLAPVLFAPFGEVLDAGVAQGRPVNQGRGQRVDVAPRLAHDPAAVRPAAAVYRLAGSSLPVVVGVLERHTLTSQVFWPLEGARAVIAVAPNLPDGAPDVSRLSAFLSGPGQGFHYLPAVWHAPLFALDVAGSFAMHMWETGTDRDCEEFPLPQPVFITWD
ncbi:MAG TPA: ureidoglycolate lyase [Azospirillum sp.]|nr:ureidoglycolate lyase [Azospirillum sp.]